MDQEKGSPTSESVYDPSGRGNGYRHFWFLALLGMMYGIIVASVLSTSPTAITVVKYVAPVFAIVGIIAGACYGFLFNIANHCTGGRLLCGIVGGLGAAAVGTMAVSLVTVFVGTVVGFASGWIVGSFLEGQRRGNAPLVGAGIGAVLQAGWTDLDTVVQTGALGGVIGAIAGPVFLLMCFGLAYLVLRKISPSRRSRNRK